MTNRGSFRSDSDETVTCIGCGDAVRRDAAREYDKHGDRFSRAGKEFEYLCKPCHRACCHQPRQGLESLLIEAGAGEVDRDAFLRRLTRHMAEDSSAPAEE